MKLRPYQEKAVGDLWAWFDRHPEGNPVVAAAVGAGKSILIAEIVRQALTTWAGTRVLMLVASKELIEQNLAKLLAVWPAAPVGVCSAALSRRELEHDIIYATIGSIWRRAHELGRIDLVLVDECHQIGSREAGMYRTLLSDLARYNPGVRVVGWTGTPFRGDGVWLTDAEEPIFHGTAARVTIRELLELEFLAPLKSAATTTRLDAEGVGMRGGDFIVSLLAKKVDRAELVSAAVAELVEIGAERRRWLVYAVTVAHASHICHELTQRGITAAVVSAETPASERADRIAAFRAGRLRAIVNVAVLTTGFDVPEVDLIALLRNTRSPVLYTQIAGRGMRICPGKDDCLWVDFTDTTAVLGPVDAINGCERPRKSRDAVAPFRLCPECGSPNATRSAECIDCGHPFPPPELINHHATASGAAVLQGGLLGRIRHEVNSVAYRLHQKPGKPDSMRVEYRAGLRVVASEWVCFEHGGYAMLQAKMWWLKRGNLPQPLTTAEALLRQSELRAPVAVVIDDGGKYPEVRGYEWPLEEAA